MTHGIPYYSLIASVTVFIPEKHPLTILFLLNRFILLVSDLWNLIRSDREVVYAHHEVFAGHLVLNLILPLPGLGELLICIE